MEESPQLTVLECSIESHPLVESDQLWDPSDLVVRY